MNVAPIPSDADRQVTRFLLQLEIDELADYLDEAVRDTAVPYEDVAAAALRYANLVVQLKVMQDRAALLVAGHRGYA